MNFYKYSFFLLSFLIFQTVVTNTSPVKTTVGLEKKFEELIDKTLAFIQDSHKIQKEIIQALPKETAVNVINATKTASKCVTGIKMSYLEGNITLVEHDKHISTCFQKLKTAFKTELRNLNTTTFECLSQTTEKPSEMNETTTNPQGLNSTIKNEQNLTNKSASNAQDKSNGKESPKDRRTTVKDIFVYQNISTKAEGITENTQEATTTDKIIAGGTNNTTKKQST